MGIFKRNLDTYCGIYDFSEAGGAIGSYDLQVPIPANVVVMEFGVFASQAITSATSTATVSFDGIVTSNSPVTTTIGLFLSATIITSWTLPGATVVMGVSPDGAIQVPFGTTIGGVPANLSIGMSIGVEALLTGQLVFFARCLSFNFIA